MEMAPLPGMARRYSACGQAIGPIHDRPIAGEADDPGGGHLALDGRVGVDEPIGFEKTSPPERSFPEIPDAPPKYRPASPSLP